MTGVVEGMGAAAGIAGVFNTAISWFDYIYVAKQAAPRLQSLLVKLDSAQLRLTRWGKAAGLTGWRITNEESVKNAYSYQLNEEQERQAILTFQTVAIIFEECQKLCHLERKGKNSSEPSVNENEINPFEATGVKWSPMHAYLHEKIQEIAQGRKNQISVPQRVKFAIYKEKHLEKLIRDINDHVDELYKIYTPSANEQDGLGKAELAELLQVVKELGLASERDPLINTAVQALYEQKVSGSIIAIII
jgi:hypothetical protein